MTYPQWEKCHEEPPACYSPKSPSALTATPSSFGAIARDLPNASSTIRWSRASNSDPSNVVAFSRSTVTRVSLITYEPCFDADRGQWYVDIEITPSKSSDPFVWFGLVRFQEHAPERLQVSEPVVAWAQLMPRRTVSVRAVKDEEGHVTIMADVFGKSGTKVKPPWARAPSTPISKNTSAGCLRPRIRSRK